MSDPSCGTRRARRIRDEEWDSHRPEIERLLGEGMSKSRVIEHLTQSGFPVTAKQLKHILAKWELKRKICNEDMKVMLKTQDLRNANGKRTQFTYYGLPVSEDKLQRAAKRIRISSPAPNVMPPHIRVLSPQTGNQTRLLAWSDPGYGFEPCNPALFHKPLPDEMTFTSHTTEDTYLSLTRLDPGSDLNGIGFDLPPHQDHQDLLFSADIMQKAPNNDDPFYSAFDVFASEMNSNDFDFGQNVFHEMPWSGNISRGNIAALPTPVPNSAIPSRLSTPLVSDNLRGSHNGRSSISHGNPDELTTGIQVLFHGSNPENAVCAVKLMRELFQQLRNEALRYSRPRAYGKSPWKLADEINRDLLTSQIENVAIYIYEASAKFLRNRRVSHGLPESDSAASMLPSSPRNAAQGTISGISGVPNGTDPSRFRTSITNCSCLKRMYTIDGMFQIALQEANDEDLDAEDNTASNILITVIPEVRTRQEAGIFATFPRGFQNQPIYPVIRTFHVVPRDSEIIRAIQMSDLVGFRKVIEDGRGSPRDVSPQGESLLYYAIFSGSFEIFQYLVENGADADQCPICTNPASLVDCIWGSHVRLMVATDGVMGLLATDSLIRGLDQCSMMTEIARKSGFLAEESIPYNKMEPTVLFQVIDSYSNKASSRLGETLNSLLAAGYDLEFRNSIGQTPLLYAAYDLRRYTLRMVDLLLAKNSDRHVVDHQGRGVLHTCLAFSDGLDETFLDFCTSPAPPAHIKSDGAEDSVTETSSPIVSEDEALFDDTISEHSSDSMLTGRATDDDDDDSEATDDMDDPYCHWCAWRKVGGIREVLWYCSVRDVDTFEISDSALYDNDFRDAEPESWMCKARVRLKLLRFLRAGCDPNLLDFEGATPSDYARREGLWPQWEWALERSGWTYDEENGLCDTRVEELDEEMMDFE